MRALKLAATVVCLSFAFGLADRPNAQGQVFTLKFCNRSNDQIQLALAHRVSPTDSRFRIRGWFNLPSGCFDVPGIPKGWVYYFGIATDGSGHWGGNATQICVSATAFDRTTGSGTYECKPNEQLVGFAGKLVEEDIYTVNFNP